jgi:GNAT superfamily N-acetyltransferase
MLAFMVAPAETPTLRTATPADRAVVVALLTDLVRELGPIEAAGELLARLPADIERALVSPTVRILLAEVDGVAVGLSRGDVLTQDPIFRLRPDQRCGYVDQMYVRPSHRNAGIGGLLLRACEDWFRSLGILHAVLHAAPRATPFYERAGYRPNREMLKRL